MAWNMTRILRRRLLRPAGRPTPRAVRRPGVEWLESRLAPTVDINFTSFPNGNGFTTNSFPGLTTVNNFPGTPPVLRLTDGNGNEGTSAWYNTAIGTGGFTTTFNLQDHPGSGAADSVLFVIQNDPGGAIGGGAGLNAVGHGGGAGGYGPDDNLNPPMILNSIGIKFDLYSGGSHNATTGFFMNGQYPGTGHQIPPGSQDVALAPINLGSTDPMSVTITYDGGTTLTETVLDTVTQAMFSHTYTMPMTLAQIVGPAGYVGFTGGTGGETATQDIQSWTGTFPEAPHLDHFTISAANTATAGAPFSVTVTALDQNGNVFTGFTGTIHFTSSDSGATLPTDYSFVAGDMGVHTFTNGVTLITAGVQSVQVASGAAIGATSVTVNAAALDHFSVVTSVTTTTAGSPFDVTVTAQDAFNNTVTSYGGTVHFTSADGAAILPADATLTNGTMTFPAGATLFTVGSGTQDITVTDNGGSGATGTDLVTVTPAAADHLVFTQQPTDTPAGGTISTVMVAVVDLYGNVITSDNTDMITISIGVDPSGGTATLSGTLTITVVNGVATFSDLSIDTSATGYTLHATNGGSVTDTDSNPFNIL
jgi:hypothetical protein